MLAQCPVQVTLPAADLQRAKRFYAEKLGLTPQSEWRDGLLYRCGANTTFLVFPSQGQVLGAHTQMAWITKDIEGEVAALKAGGVVFEEYDLPGLKTVNSVATLAQGKGAWLKESEGNLLAVDQLF
jgi:catechol 2,3-dioxygenase-like lactoylglutathione lyase family enzyme